MKKTIDIWVTKEGIEGLAIKATSDNFIKGTLTYEEEEPKIEITPSQLKEAIKNHNNGYYNEAVMPLFKSLAKELFGEIE